MTELGIDVIPNLDPTLRHRASPAQTKFVNSRGPVRRLPVTRLPAAFYPNVVAQSLGQGPVGRGSAAEISVWPGCGNGSAGVLEMLPGRAHRACVVSLGGVGAHGLVAPCAVARFECQYDRPVWFGSTVPN